MKFQKIPAQAKMHQAQTAINYEAFLHDHLNQPHNIMRYDNAHETLWVKCAGKGNPALNYWLLSTLAKLFSAPVLQPVPNPGGSESIQTEARRLRSFKTKGLRVPEVLATTQQAFVMRHLGRPGQEAPSLSNAIEDAIAQGAGATLKLWQQGLDAIHNVHNQGEVLSQAVARNMVVCADGVIGFIDFEDDPAAHLPRAVCMARDALNYAQSTALFLQQAGAMEQAKALWLAFVKQLPGDAQQVLAGTVKKLSWVRILPRSKSLGRDTLRVLAAHELLNTAA
nr:RIO1 family regulatory kinase/ATPase [Comamonas sp. Y33R10-2]